MTLLMYFSYFTYHLYTINVNYVRFVRMKSKEEYNYLRKLKFCQGESKSWRNNFEIHCCHVMCVFFPLREIQYRLSFNVLLVSFGCFYVILRVINCYCSLAIIFHRCNTVTHYIYIIIYLYATLLLQKIDERAVTEVFCKVLDNYTKWCRYLGKSVAWTR